MTLSSAQTTVPKLPVLVRAFLRTELALLVAAEDGAVSRYAIDSASELLEPEQRRTASVKLAYQRNLREGMLKVNESPEKFILVATQPLQCLPVLGALDATARFIPRDDSDRAVAKRRSAVGWALARQAAIATVIARKGCESTVDARAAMMVAKRLLRTTIPPAASALRPTGSVPEVKLAPPTKAAEDRITAAVVKSELHILTCDQPWGYDAIASFPMPTAPTKPHTPFPTPSALTLPPKRRTAAIRTAKGLIDYNVNWDGVEGAADHCLVAMELLHLARQSVDILRWWTMRWPHYAVGVLVSRRLFGRHSVRSKRAVRLHRDGGRARDARRGWFSPPQSSRAVRACRGSLVLLLFARPVAGRRPRLAPSLRPPLRAERGRGAQGGDR